MKGNFVATRQLNFLINYPPYPRAHCLKQNNQYTFTMKTYHSMCKYSSSFTFMTMFSNCIFLPLVQPVVKHNSLVLKLQGSSTSVDVFTFNSSCWFVPTEQSLISSVDLSSTPPSPSPSQTTCSGSQTMWTFSSCSTTLSFPSSSSY